MKNSKFIVGIIPLLLGASFMSGCWAPSAPEGTPKGALFYVDEDSKTTSVYCNGQFEGDTLDISSEHDGKNVIIGTDAFKKAPNLKTINVELKDGFSLLFDIKSFRKCNLEVLNVTGEGKCTIKNEFEGIKELNLSGKAEFVDSAYNQINICNLSNESNGELYYVDDLYLHDTSLAEVESPKRIIIDSININLTTHEVADTFILCDGIYEKEKQINCSCEVKSGLFGLGNKKFMPLAFNIYISNNINHDDDILGESDPGSDKRVNLYVPGKLLEDDNNLPNYVNLVEDTEIGKNCCTSEEHHYVFGETLNPTCETSGFEYKTCDLCGLKLHNIFMPLGHDYELKSIQKEATCVSEGIALYECSHCHTTKTEEIALKEHEFEFIQTVKSPTCTELGQDLYVCKNCGLEKTQEIPMVAHSLKTIESQEATCTEKGHGTYQICEVCGTIFGDKNETPALEHKFDHKIGSVDSTCETQGYDIYECSICHNATTQKDFKPLAPHTSAFTKKIEPTCTEEGKEPTEYCSVCGKTIAEGKTIPPTGHLDESPCDGNCDSCGEKIADVITISTLVELKSIDAESTSKIYCLTNDIDANEEVYFKVFNCKLYGNSHTISNLNGPLIGTNNGTVFGLNLSDVTHSKTISPYGSADDFPDKMGLLCNVNNGIIKNCCINGSNKIEMNFKYNVYFGGGNGIIDDIFNVIQNSDVVLSINIDAGGICGLNSGTVSNCSVSSAINCVIKTDINYDGLVTLELDDGRKGTSNIVVNYGGIVGKNDSGVIENNVNNDSLSNIDVEILGSVVNKSFGYNYVNMTLNQGKLYGVSSDEISDKNDSCTLSSFVMTGYSEGIPALNKKVEGSSDIVTDSFLGIPTKYGHIKTSFILKNKTNQ